MRTSDIFIDGLDYLRSLEKDLPSRAEMLRRLVHGRMLVVEREIYAT